jgi:hypothetical protein
MLLFYLWLMLHCTGTVNFSSSHNFLFLILVVRPTGTSKIGQKFKVPLCELFQAEEDARA